MKKLKRILICVAIIIKKKIFKSRKTDIYQECEKVLNFNEKKTSEFEREQIEEYINNYKVTTRWQTL